METAEYVTHLECALTNMRAKYEQMIDEKNALCAEVERLREERRWIPVGERLPGSGRHLVTDGSIRWTAFWYDDCWAHNEPTHRQRPTHWMPLPAPPDAG